MIIRGERKYMLLLIIYIYIYILRLFDSILFIGQNYCLRQLRYEIRNFALIYQAKGTIYGLLFTIKTVYFGTLYFIWITIITFSSSSRLNFLLFFGLSLSYTSRIYSSAIFFLCLNNVEQICLKVFFYVVCLVITMFLPKYL